MYLPILILPFLGFIYSNVFGRFVGNAGGRLIATSLLCSTFSLSCLAFYEVAVAGSSCQINLGN
jgi:NADH:ubiquinone oxidoreductase subunit 5 (subunit L)/multisubunit Na+/H+ antiporter MnhA subunit